MSSGERPIGTAKGKQPDIEALCQPRPPPDAPTFVVMGQSVPRRFRRPVLLCSLHMSPASVIGQCHGRCIGFRGWYPRPPPQKPSPKAHDGRQDQVPIGVGGEPPPPPKPPNPQSSLALHASEAPPPPCPWHAASVRPGPPGGPPPLPFAPQKPQEDRVRAVWQGLTGYQPRLMSGPTTVILGGSPAKGAALGLDP